MQAVLKCRTFQSTSKQPKLLLPYSPGGWGLQDRSTIIIEVSGTTTHSLGLPQAKSTSPPPMVEGGVEGAGVAGVAGAKCHWLGGCLLSFFNPLSTQLAPWMPGCQLPCQPEGAQQARGLQGRWHPWGRGGEGGGLTASGPGEKHESFFLFNATLHSVGPGDTRCLWP